MPVQNEVHAFVCMYILRFIYFKKHFAATENGGKNSIQAYYLEINEIYLAAEPQRQQFQKPQEGGGAYTVNRVVLLIHVMFFYYI